MRTAFTDPLAPGSGLAWLQPWTLDKQDQARALDCSERPAWGTRGEQSRPRPSCGGGRRGGVQEDLPGTPPTPRSPHLRARHGGKGSGSMSSEEWALSAAAGSQPGPRWWAKAAHPAMPSHRENRVVLGFTQRLKRLVQRPVLSPIPATKVTVDFIMARPGEHHSLRTWRGRQGPGSREGSLSPAKEPKPSGRLLPSLPEHRLPANVTVPDGWIFC